MASPIVGPLGNAHPLPLSLLGWYPHRKHTILWRINSHVDMLNADEPLSPVYIRVTKARDCAVACPTCDETQHTVRTLILRW